MHWYLEFATLKQFHLKASSKQWVAMRCYAAAERCSLICLPPSKCTSKLGALLGLWPGQSFNLDPATTSKLWCNGTIATEKKIAMIHLLEAIAELLPWESSKLMSVVQAKLTISNINQTVSDAAGSWCQGTIQSCQLEFWNLCQVETSQNVVIVKRSNKMVHKVIWLGSLSVIIVKPLEIVRSEANLITTPLEPLRAWICRSYGQDAVGTWRCPVAVAQLHEMTWPCNISPASIPPKLVKLIVFFCRGLHCSRFFGSAHLSAHSFLDMGHFHWESWSAISSPYLGPSIPRCKFSVSTKDFHRCGFNRTMGPSTLRSAKSLSSAMNYEPISEHELH